MKAPSLERSSRGMTLTELLVAVLLLAVLAALLLPVARGAYARSRRAACMTNLRSLSSIFHHYAADHQGAVRFLRDGSKWTMWYTELRKHAGLSESEAQRTFGCPLVRWQETGAWNCYGMRLGYLITPIARDPGYPIERHEDGASYGFRLTRVENPSQFLLLVDSATASGKQNFRIADRGLYNSGGICLRHDGIANALFLDGRVEPLALAGFRSLGITAVLDEKFKVVTP